MNQIGTVSCLLLLSLTVKAQQSFTYNQYSENLTPVNMAYSLLHPLGRADVVARKQWIGVQGAPSTLILNGYLPVGDDETMAAGITLMHDNLAVENQTEANAFFAKSIQISEADHLAVALNVGARRYKTNFSSIDPEDPVLHDDIEEIVPNVGFSIMLFEKNDEEDSKYYFGVSVPRLFIRALGGAASRSSAYLKNQFYLTAGISKYLTDDIRIKPAVLVSHSDNVPLQGDLSVTAYLQEKFGIGFNYRTNNELAGIFSFKLGETIHLGYSYQFGMGSRRIGNFGNATHEMGISYRFGFY